MVYQQKMAAATRGKGSYPSITTFRPGQNASTNSAHRDTEHAQSWYVSRRQPSADGVICVHDHRCACLSLFINMCFHGDGRRQELEEVKISDMTWEQKERVLRLLFAKMNGVATTTSSSHLPPLPTILPALSPAAETTFTHGHAHIPTSLIQAPVFLTQPSGRGTNHTLNSIHRSSISLTP